MKIFVIHFKETTDNGMSVETGIFDYAYTDESKAIKDITDTITTKLGELEEEFEEGVETYTNETGDYQSITCPNGDTYEYNTQMVIVENTPLC